MRVNNNIFAQNAYRNLFDTSGRLGKSLEKLSSGLRINRAADDAAGLGVSEKLRSQVSGLQVAIDNVQDGIAVIQTAEGALDRTHAILRRVRDLTEASANGDKTDEDRQMYQAEIDQLVKEIDRISLTTEYNTKKLLSGALGATVIEDVSKLDVNVTALSVADSELIKSVSVTGSVPVKGVYTVELNTTLSSIEKVANLQYAATQSLAAAAGNWAASAKLQEVFVMNTAGGESETLTFTQPMRGKEAAVTLFESDTIADAVKKIQDSLNAQGMEIDVKWNPDANGDGTLTDGTFQFEARNRGSAYNFFVSGQNSSSTVLLPAEVIAGNEPFVPATFDADGDGNYEFVAGAGLEAVVLEANDLSALIYDPNGTITTVTSTSSTFRADFSSSDYAKVIDADGLYQGIAGIEFTLDVDSLFANYTANGIHAGIDVSGLMTFQAGPNKGDDHRISVAIGDMGARGIGVSGLDVTTQSAAQQLIDSEKIDGAIKTVSSERGKLGALQNRFEHTIKNLGITKENLAGAESRIRDTDMAKEMMEFTRNQIMQQAGTAMLAQANMANQSVLQLLG